MKPNYIAKKSVVPVLNFWLILFFWLVIPLIIQIVRILSVKSFSIEFYDDRMIIKSGILNTREDQSVFMGVYSVSISQSLFGRMCDYGDIRVDCPGKWDIDTTGIKDPYTFKAFLESKIARANTTNVLYN